MESGNIAKMTGSDRDAAPEVFGTCAAGRKGERRPSFSGGAVRRTMTWGALPKHLGWSNTV